MEINRAQASLAGIYQQIEVDEERAVEAHKELLRGAYISIKWTGGESKSERVSTYPPTCIFECKNPTASPDAEELRKHKNAAVEELLDTGYEKQGQFMFELLTVSSEPDRLWIVIRDDH